MEPYAGAPWVGRASALSVALAQMPAANLTPILRRAVMRIPAQKLALEPTWQPTQELAQDPGQELVWRLAQKLAHEVMLALA